MNALATQSHASITPALGGDASNEMRALTSWEVDEVSGGNLLFMIGGILFIGIICKDYGEEIDEASQKLAEWIRG